MCGISGFYNCSGNTMDKGRLLDMLNAIKHRGPDEEGIYYNKNIGLGMRRLSIVDKANGQQPIYNETKDIVVVFNGEIYNYKNLREDLIKKGHSFYTNTDTEVIVHLYEEYKEDFINYINGMFGIAIWDNKSNKMILARDRLGVKPIYYCFKNNTVLFGSEIKSLLNSGFIKAEVNSRVIGSYLTYRFIPGEQTMFKNIYKLMPGHMITYDGNKFTNSSYWDINVDEYNKKRLDENHVENIKNIFSESIKARTENESSIGVLLSGGLDSTIVLSEASKFCKDIKTYSVHFEKPDLNINKVEYNEIDYARRVANNYQTEHYEYKIGSREVIDDIEKIVTYMDEPISDPTSIPLFYVSRLAKKNSRVVLSGEGADEIFGGYSIYREPRSINRYLKIPKIARNQIIERLYKHLPLKYGKDFIRRANKSIEERYKGVGLTFRNHEITSILDSSMSECIDDCSIEEYVESIYKKCSGFSDEDKMMYFDQKIWLPEDVLVKTDKMSMAHSVELRVPFLDHKLVEYLSAIPFTLKNKNNIEKYILKEAFKEGIPSFVVNRKKAGFPVPISAFLSKEFKNFSKEILLSRRFIDRGYFNKEFIIKLLNDHISNNYYVGRQIWLLITFELWHRIFIDNNECKF
jgi:asparagine synthase (glutamine-hydrolysing)